MDDDVVVWLILLLVVGIGGWFLGAGLTMTFDFHLSRSGG